MAKFLKKLLLLLPIPLAMIVVNLAGDPANLFGGGRYEREIATILAADGNATVSSNYDERLVQRHYAERISASREVLVLGSSRSMLIDRRLFPGRSFFNCSVSGATLEDDLAIYQMYRRRGHLPSRVVLGLDPWLLNSNNGQTRWVSISEEFGEIARELRLPHPLTKAEVALDRGKKYLEALSPEYFRQSLLFLVKRKSRRVVATAASEGETNIKLSDGSLSYSRGYKSRPASEVEAEAASYAKGDEVYSLTRFGSLDPAKVAMLEEFLKLLDRDKVAVEFFLPPYHPKAYDGIVSSGKFRGVTQAEEYFRKLAKKKGITLYGSYDPHLLHLRCTDFHDGMHPTAATTARILISPQTTEVAATGAKGEKAQQQHNLARAQAHQGRLP